MTAVVGILNKHSVAIAADSAVTITRGGKSKIFNRANKIFALSKYFPVGIMIYNSASFMGTPWEILIKIYRQSLKDTNFQTLKQFQEDFVLFLRSKGFFTEEDTQKKCLKFTLMYFNDLIVNRVFDKNPGLNPRDSSQTSGILSLIESEIDVLTQEFINKNDWCEDFINYDFTEFNNFAGTIVNDLIKETYENNGFILSAVQKEKLNILFYNFVKSKEKLNPYFTGLVFTGYGENEIYPSLVSLNVSFSIDNKLRYFIESETSISNLRPSAICPFAQVDVINTILRGVAPQLQEAYINSFDKFLDDYNQELITAAGPGSTLGSMISRIDRTKLVSQYIDINNQIIRENYINPLLSAIESLSKEDLSEMAESLIYTTYLKRRITDEEESVGGPVDVAILSKGDGFVWIKRKHYFRPELNAQFFNNYFK